jgi:KaiC/GvpD/RAD55 family RecA-like ATPase
MGLEKRLIVGCINDESIITQVKSSSLEPKHLNNEQNKYLLDAILELDSIGDVSFSVLKDYISSDESIHGDKKDALKTRLKDLKGEDVGGVNFSIQKISDIAKKREFTELLNESVELFEQKDDVDQVLDRLSKRVRRIQGSGTDYDLYDYMGSYPEREVERSKIEEGSEDNLTIGLNLYPFRDPYFKKGLLPKQTTAIGGPTYAGKSVAMINFIRMAAHPINGFNVLYVVSENRRIEAASRLDSVILGKEYDELYEEQLDKDGQDFFEDALHDGWGKIFLSKVRIQDFDSSTIEAMLHDVKGRSGEQIDVLAIDSPDHQNALGDAEQWWRRKGMVYAENKQLAEEYDLINLTTLPMKPSSAKGDTIGPEDTAGSYDIARYCDNLIMFNVDPSDRKLNRGKLQVTKSRDGQVDEETLYFYFENNLRLLPWDDVFNGQVSPETDDEETDSELKCRIRNYKEEQEYENVEGTRFNVEA